MQRYGCWRQSFMGLGMIKKKSGHRNCFRWNSSQNQCSVLIYCSLKSQNRSWVWTFFMGIPQGFFFLKIGLMGRILFLFDVSKSPRCTIFQFPFLLQAYKKNQTIWCANQWNTDIKAGIQTLIFYSQNKTRVGVFGLQHFRVFPSFSPTHIFFGYASCPDDPFFTDVPISNLNGF